jgi:hypothetical protein
MDHVFTIYSVLFIATSLVSFFVAFIAFQRTSVSSALIYLTILTWIQHQSIPIFFPEDRTII